MASPGIPYEAMVSELAEAIGVAGASSNSSSRAALGRLHKIRQEIRTGGLDAGLGHGVAHARAKIATIKATALTALAGQEVQQVSIVGGDSGSLFTLTFQGQTTGNLTKGTATAAQVATALDGLSNLAAADISVSGPTGGPYTIVFLEAGAYGDADVGEITGTGVGVNEVQTLTKVGTASANNFKLTFNGEQTADISETATATQVRDAIRALPSVVDTDLTGGGGPLGTGPVTITFDGTLAASNVSLLVSDDVAITVAQTTPGSNPPSVAVNTLQAGS